MKKRFTVLFTSFLIVIAAALSGCAGQTSPAKCYRAYFGLNDAAVGSQLLSAADAAEQIRAILTESGVGYTEYVAYGAYVEGETVTGDATLVYEFFYTDKELVQSIVSRAKSALNLASVLLVEIDAVYDFVS